MTDIAPVQSELRDYAGREITFKELGDRAKNLLGRQAVDRVMDILVIGANEMRNDIMRSMRNTRVTSAAAGKAGRLYSKGYNKKGKRVMHRASAPGYPPAVDNSDLIRSIIVDARWAEVEVGSIITNPAYPLWLENGTKEMAARPWLEPARRRNDPRIKMAVRRVLRQIAAEMTE